MNSTKMDKVTMYSYYEAVVNEAIDSLEREEKYLKKLNSHKKCSKNTFWLAAKGELIEHLFEMGAAAALRSYHDRTESSSLTWAYNAVMYQLDNLKQKIE